MADRPGTGMADRIRTVTDVVVPVGVTWVDFVVIGGSGGASPAGDGGYGAKVTGRLQVTAGQTLSLVVGAGGLGHNDGGGISGGGTNLGGGGWGVGGDSGAVPIDSANHAGASGGGGSAITLGATPFVIAGGGGGGGTRVTPVRHEPNFSETAGPHGGNGNQDAPNHRGWVDLGAVGGTLWTSLSDGGHSPATGGTAGGLGGQDAAGWANPVPKGPAPNSVLRKNPGQNGAARSLAGSDGGNGTYQEFVGVPATTGYVGYAASGSAAGGGGGGYGGGGGGASTLAKWYYSSDSISENTEVLSCAGGGGGGNYVDTTKVTGAEYGWASAHQTVQDARLPGYVSVTYCVPQ